MVKAVIFDCFGVLATEAWLSFKAKYFGRDSELFGQATEISWQADRGLISYDDFIQAIARLARITPAETLRAIRRNVPDEELFAYIKELKPDYKLGLLSNVADNYLHQIFTKEHLALFDALVLSYRNGFIKPQPEAFINAAKELEVGVEECVFIDDQERNVNGAREAGMRAILYHDAAQLRKELGASLKT
ncbi:MAG TPA: HAD family phosphatase [Candidatus Dormibacteraeota bacterium]|nr:HAD family phosphatase [Candidatus Dormibacteraeota bacterium]